MAILATGGAKGHAPPARRSDGSPAASAAGGIIMGLAGVRRSACRRKRGVMQEMNIYGVSFDMVGKQPIVLLKTQSGNKFLPDLDRQHRGDGDSHEASGRRDAAADDPRPARRTWCAGQRGGLRVAVTELRDNTFMAVITLRLASGEIEIDRARRMRWPWRCVSMRRSSSTTRSSRKCVGVRGRRRRHRRCRGAIQGIPR